MSASEQDRSRPTVLQLVRTLQMGGAEMLTIDTARWLAQAGQYRPVVCAWRRGGALEQRLDDSGLDFQILNLPRRPVWALPLCLRDLSRAVEALRQLIRQQNVALIHAHMSEAGFIAALAAPALNCPVVITMHNTVFLPSDIPRWSPIYALRRLLLKWTLKRVDRVITCSDAAKESLVRQMPLVESEVESVPNGIVVSDQLRPVNRRHIRESIGLKEQDRILICVGRLRTYKGQGTLIEMMPQLLQRFPTARLVLCGTGPDEAAFRQRAAELGLADKILFLGDRSDVPDLLRAADVFVTASRWEGLSLALLEAMEAGLPVVSAPAPGNTEVLEDGAGVVASSMEATDILESTIRVLGDTSWANDLGQCARQRVVDQYSSQRMMKQLTGIYDQLLSARSASRKSLSAANAVVAGANASIATRPAEAARRG